MLHDPLQDPCDPLHSRSSASSTNGMAGTFSGLSIIGPCVTNVSGANGASLPESAGTGTVRIYMGRTSAGTDTVTIPEGESVWYRTVSGASTLLNGPTTLDVNRQNVMLIKSDTSWKIIGLYYA